MILAAEPYPWPYDGELDPTRLALVIAGDQPAWVACSESAPAVASVIDVLVSMIRSAGGLVVHVRHAVSAAVRDRCPALAQLRLSARQLAVCSEAGDLVVEAAGIDGFYGSSLDRDLRATGIHQLVFAGFGAEAAVSSTLRTANDKGYECLTLTDAVAPFEGATGRRALSSITMSGGIFGAIAPSDALLAALRESTVPATAEAIS